MISSSPAIEAESWATEVPIPPRHRAVAASVEQEIFLISISPVPPVFRITLSLDPRVEMTVP
jgi:hypothetical protein